MKLRTRLSFFYAALTALSLIAFGVVGYAVEVAAEALEDETEAEKEAELAQFRARMLLVMAGALPGSVLIAFLGATWMTRRTFQVVDGVVRTAEVLELDQLHARIPSPAGAGAEVERLVASLNGMLERLERSTLGLRRFTADAAHELRTPLAVLGGRLESSLTNPGTREHLLETQAAALADVEGLGRLVEALLTLARSDAGQVKAVSRPTSIGQLCGRVVEAYVDQAAQRGMTIVLEVPDDLNLQIDGAFLERVVANLVDNAVKFGKDNGTITVHARPTQGGVELDVMDDGPGLTQAEQARVFTRFFRGEQGHGAPGSGLGLALAREYVQALGGTIAVSNASTGGVIARLHLPAAPAGIRPAG